MYSDPSQNSLLDNEDDSWGGWEDTDSWQNKKETSQSKKKNKPQKVSEEDEFEAWLNEDMPLQSSNAKSKSKDEWDDWGEEKTDKKKNKKSDKSVKKAGDKSSGGDGWSDVNWDSDFSSPQKQKQPLVGNLLDFGEDEEQARVAKGTSSGWDNEVWADEEDDDNWQSLEESSKLK